MRANRWAKNGVLDHIFSVLQDADVINIQVGQVLLDRMIVQIHPDGTGALKKTVFKLSGSQEEGGQRKFTW